MTSVILTGTSKEFAELARFAGIEPQTVDIRRLSGTGFRISNDSVGDERWQLNRAKSAVVERLRKAWGLAFAECPSAETAPF
jgi:hypothetical protein